MDLNYNIIMNKITYQKKTLLLFYFIYFYIR